MTTSPRPDTPEVVWHPTKDRVERAQMTHFLRRVAEEVDEVEDYESLYRWSIEDPAAFWKKVWSYCGIIAKQEPEEAVRGVGRMLRKDGRPGADWFPGARLNFAENLLRHATADDAGEGEREALVAWNEEGRQGAWTYQDLQRDVARLARTFRHLGVGPGDRVAAFLPNLPETVIAMLAATSLGATWSSCSPDFGIQGVHDRFGQIEPKILLAADGYRFAGKEHGSLDKVEGVLEKIPGIEKVLVVPYLRDAEDIGDLDAGPELRRRALLWNEALANEAEGIDFAHLPFDHPLYVLYSSGTTGLPKCMVHGAGGTLIQHLKELVLHVDLRRDDRIFYYTTCGWMMWNWLVSSLAVGATVILYDGSPLKPRPESLFDMAEKERITVFGTSAKYLAMAEKEGLRPAETHDLSRLRTVLSTGSPLAPESYDWVYGEMVEHDDLQLASISGGTDLVSCFALGNPVRPVYRGELQARGLGMAVDVWTDDGESIVGRPGELVCTRPFPSMPVRFWNDPDHSRYRAAYFDHFPTGDDGSRAVWRHGDWAELTERGGLVIYGRSDATLNPGGVRIGTAEIYRQVEKIDDVLESLVIGQEWQDDVRIVLFVRLRDGVELDDALRDRIRREIRRNASPFHVPKKILQVPDLPKTLSGKITEMAVHRIVHGRPVKNRDALANPESLEHFADRPELR